MDSWPVTRNEDLMVLGGLNIACLSMEKRICLAKAKVAEISLEARSFDLKNGFRQNHQYDGNMMDLWEIKQNKL